MKKKPPPWLVLTGIAVVAGALLGAVEAVTSPMIAKNAQTAADAERFVVFPDADAFEALPIAEDATVDDCRIASRGGEALGHVGRITVNGYGGKIEVTAGVAANGTVTGIAVGGADFSETAGLGARTREPEFTDQFIGVTLPVTLNGNVDAISGASISSGAVVSGVNKIAAYIDGIGKDPAQTDPYGHILLDGSEAIAHDGTVDGAYKTADGYVVYASQTGYHGPIHVAVAMDPNGVVTKVAIDQNDFQETAGLGERVLEDWFLVQYIGKSGVIGVRPGEKSDAVSSATGESGTAEGEADASDAESSATVVVETIEGAGDMIDGVSGATISSTAVTKAVNAAIAFVQSARLAELLGGMARADPIIMQIENLMEE